MNTFHLLTKKQFSHAPDEDVYLAVNPYGSMNSGRQRVIISISSGVVPKCTKVAPFSSIAPNGKACKASHVSIRALERA